MVVTVLFALGVWSTGFGSLRLLGLAKGPLALGLSPSVGLAVIAIASTWMGLLQVPPPLPGLVIAAMCVAGLALVAGDGKASGRAIASVTRQQPGASVVLCAALLVPLVVMGIAFADIQAPLSPHDGAFHVETTNTFRLGMGASAWYPPGLAAMFGATLQVIPWVDTALGAHELGVALSLMAPIAVFGLAVTIWRNLLAAAGAALLTGLTYLFPYYPQIWSGWPQTVGIFLVIGLWMIALVYLREPTWRVAGVAGVLVGAMVVVHGTEIYSSAIVLAAIGLANWRRLPVRQLLRHLPVAILIAFACAAPYLPVLLHWAGTGGAFDAGYEDATSLAIGAKSTTAGDLLTVFTLDALGIDLPIRIILIALGIALALGVRAPRAFGSPEPSYAGPLRTALGVCAAFYVLALVSSFLNGVPLVAQVFSITYPWSLPFRLVMFATLPVLVVAGGGCVLALELWGVWLSRVRNRVAHRLVSRLGRLLVLTWALLSCASMTYFLSLPAGLLSSFSPIDDGAGMAWLRGNVSSSEVVVNDEFADAGIWAPYKAGVQILIYRSGSDAATAAMRSLVLKNVGNLDGNPQVMAAACALNARYVYYGAEQTQWQPRTFPDKEVLDASPALEAVFRQGEATVYRVRLTC